jgi:hypothetical protein
VVSNYLLQEHGNDFAFMEEPWLICKSGRAIRLIFELGLHRNPEEMESLNLSAMDLEVRRTVFWGCFTYDR